MASSSASASSNAFVTLLTSDHYLPGALVLAQSIRLAHGLSRDGRHKHSHAAATKRFDIVALITPDSLSVQTVKALRRSGLFDWIVGVEQIGFKQILATRTEGKADDLEVNDTIRRMEKNLALLGRPDLQDTLTKLHVWRLGKDAAATLPGIASSMERGQVWQGYDKIVFLDADMLVLRPIDHLFSLKGDPHFAASPDTGWPDAFNSGLMLLTPSVDTFEAIRTFARQRGSWDGADQGLLNDYFGHETEDDPPQPGSEAAPGGGWKRLSFRYNVTSHGGYTFAPAYQRYGTSIMASHFIGQHKPWNRPRPHGSADPNPHVVAGQHQLQHHQYSATINPSQADYLLALWHDTYASLYPASAPGSPSSGIEVVHTLRGVEVIERRAFTVPTYRAVWDAEETQDREREVESFHQPQQPLIAEAHYHSLPLDGRTSLIAPQPRVPTPPTPTPRDFQSSGSHHTLPIPHPKRADPVSIALPPSKDNSDGTDSPDHFSPPKLSWDPAHAPPPAGSGAQFYQMRNPPDTYYQNAWDEDQKAPRTLAEKKAAFFVPPNASLKRGDGKRDSGGFGYIPPSLKRDHVFDNLGGHRPDPSKIKPIFPWEHTKKAVAPTRVFPDEPRPSPPPPTAGLSAVHGGQTVPARTVMGFDTEETRRDSGASSPTASTISTSSVVRRGLPSNLSYTNAWDEEDAIGKFAQWWTKASTQGSAKEVGVQAAPHTRHRSAQTASKQRTAHAGTLTVDVGTSVYENHAEGDAGAQSDSRDGDDESSSGEDDSDEDHDRSGAPSATSSTKARSPTWPREGPSKGYQRKAENSPMLQMNATPRSPRTGSRFIAHAASGQPVDPRLAGTAIGAVTVPTGRARQRIRPDGWTGSSPSGTPPKGDSPFGVPPSYYRRRSQDGHSDVHSRSGSGSGSGGSGTTSPTNAIGLRGTSHSSQLSSNLRSSFSSARRYGAANGPGTLGAPTPIQTRSSAGNGHGYGSGGSRGVRTPTHADFSLAANVGAVDVPLSSSPVNTRAELDQQSRAYRKVYPSGLGGGSSGGL